MDTPERLGKYSITEVLGEGAMGVVYKGFDPDIKRTVAIKTIRRQFGVSGEGVSAAARFRNEAVAAGRLTHPGIVAVYDFGEHEDVAFIAMEFVEGKTLAHYLSSRVRFTDEDIPGVICQVLDALEHAHDAGVWHRDIKPANIIMAKNGKLKVADFGIARIEDAGLTQANVMIGTPTYMAPEQFLGTKMDKRVDIYACGVLLYILLTGKPPFSGPQEQLMYKVVHEAPTLPSQVEGANRPHFYDSIIAKALAKDPEQRFPDAASFRDAVQRGVGQPFDTTVWERTLIGVAEKVPAQVKTPGTGSRSGVTNTPTNTSGSWTQLPDHWDKAVLKEAEALAGQAGGAAGQRAGEARRARVRRPAQPLCQAGRAGDQPAGQDGLPGTCHLDHLHQGRLVIGLAPACGLGWCAADGRAGRCRCQAAGQPRGAHRQGDGQEDGGQNHRPRCLLRAAGRRRDRQCGAAETVDRVEAAGLTGLGGRWDASAPPSPCPLPGRERGSQLHPLAHPSGH